MVKTIAINDKVHELLLNKRNELNSAGIYLKIGDLAEMSIQLGINGIKDEVMKRLKGE